MTKKQKLRAVALLLETAQEARMHAEIVTRQIAGLTGASLAEVRNAVEESSHTAACDAQTLVGDSDGHWCACVQKGRR